MNEWISKWLHLKSLNGYYSIKSDVLVEVGQSYYRGITNQYGRLLVRGKPNDSFEVIDGINWDDMPAISTNQIVMGLLDFCIGVNQIPVLGISFELKKLRIDDEDFESEYYDPAAIPFYHLGRWAAEKIINLAEVDYNRRINQHFLSETEFVDPKK